MSEIAQHLEEIRTEIQQQSPQNMVNLIAVSKTKPVSLIQQALDANQRIFGENQVQEAWEKWLPLKEQYDDLELHLIGPLQTNKVRKALQLFDVIEVLDRPKLARYIARIAQEENRKPKLYIQVNIGNEPQKAGIAPEALQDFFDYCHHEEKLNIKGLMAIPPQSDDASLYFRALKELQLKLKLPELSMGMSSDYPQAIACGATHIRIGSQIFGTRS